MQKMARKKTPNNNNSKNDKFSKSGKIGQFQKAVACAKWSVYGQNKNCKKHAKNDSRTTLELLYAKTGSEKHLIFEK